MKHNRVLVFSTDDHLYPAGGAEQAFGNITERLPHITFDLICAKLRKGVSAYDEVGNVCIHRMGFGIPKVDGIILALFGQYCAYKLMRKYQYDFVWSIMASYGAFAAVRIKKQTRLPFLLTLQEGDSFEYIYEKVKYVRGLFNEIFTIADGVQAISHYLLNWGKSMGYKGLLGRVIPNGVAIESFLQTYSVHELQETRGSFGFSQNAFVVITSSRLEKKNGINDVIEALALLPKEVCFVVCGSGSLEVHIKKRVEELGLKNRVVFLGFVQPSKLPLLLKASDAFIRPSLTEGLGNAFLEAMAARIPVIGTSAGGISDFLTDGRTGFVVEIENPKSITNAIGRVRALTPNEKEELLNRAQKMVIENYDWDLISVDMGEMFNAITA